MACFAVSRAASFMQEPLGTLWNPPEPPLKSLRNPRRFRECGSLRSTRVAGDLCAQQLLGSNLFRTASIRRGNWRLAMAVQGSLQRLWLYGKEGGLSAREQPAFLSLFKNKRIFRTRLSQTGAKLTLFSYFASVSNSAPYMNIARNAYRTLALTHATLESHSRPHCTEFMSRQWGTLSIF